MSFFDWNGDGKKDWQDDFLEYGAYRYSTKNMNDDDDDDNFFDDDDDDDNFFDDDDDDFWDDYDNDETDYFTPATNNVSDESTLQDIGCGGLIVFAIFLIIILIYLNV